MYIYYKGKWGCIVTDFWELGGVSIDNTNLEEWKRPLVDQVSLGDVIDFWANQLPEKTAIIDANGSISYAGLCERIHSARKTFGKYGISKGKNVVAVMPGGIEFAILLFAAMKEGINLIPLDILTTTEELGIRLELAKPVMVFVAKPEHMHECEALGYSAMKVRGAENASLSEVGTSGKAQGLGDVPEHIEPLEGFLDDEKIPFAPTPLGLLDRDCSFGGHLPILTIFTSGTTGNPKGVLLSKGGLEHAIGSIQCALRALQDDVFITSLPVSHIYGINTGFLLPMKLGATSVIMPKFRASMMLDLMERHRVTVVNGVPSMYKRIAHEQERCSRDLASMRTGTIAGAKCSNLEEYERILHCSLRVIYGSTECPIVAFTTEGDSLDVAITGVGRFNELVQAKVVDSVGKEVNPGESGEIVCKNPGAMIGYLDNPVATAERIDREGWVHMDDLGYVDSDGYVHIIGRVGDVINRGGYKVYPAEIEKIYGRIQLVADCCAMGFPHEELGEQIVLFVEAKECVSDVQLRDYAKGRLAKYEIPDQVIVLDHMPHLANGKLNKHALAQLYEESGQAFHSDAELRERLSNRAK